MYTQHVFFIHHPTDGAHVSLLRGQEDKVGLRVCAILALSIHTDDVHVLLLREGGTRSL